MTTATLVRSELIRRDGWTARTLAVSTGRSESSVRAALRKLERSGAAHRAHRAGTIRGPGRRPDVWRCQ